MSVVSTADSTVLVGMCRHWNMFIGPASVVQVRLTSPPVATSPLAGTTVTPPIGCTIDETHYSTLHQYSTLTTHLLL